MATRGAAAVLLACRGPSPRLQLRGARRGHVARKTPRRPVTRAARRAPFRIPLASPPRRAAPRVELVGEGLRRRAEEQVVQPWTGAGTGKQVVQLVSERPRRRVVPRLLPSILVFHPGALLISTAEGKKLEEQEEEIGYCMDLVVSFTRCSIARMHEEIKPLPSPPSTAELPFILSHRVRQQAPAPLFPAFIPATLLPVFPCIKGTNSSSPSRLL